MSAPNAKQRRLFWMQQMRLWHWISSAACLAGLLLFALTGITLNHAAQIEAKPKVVDRHAQLPRDLMGVLAAVPADAKGPLPAPIAQWIAKDLSVQVAAKPVDWSADEAYVSLPRPGGDASLTIERESGAVEYEKTTRGMISLLNDLHKGRNAGPAWGWFIDVFAASCLIFSITGLVLLSLNAKTRPATWPLVAAGVAIPLIVAVLFLHL
jgi:hypothetical protein